ncbi:MAG: undecaprenyl-diphosphate phosphatase [Deltaproteobacteria bacterium]|nr:undecaprenyl-diphosphate phosphatase [Deltaproteobacteria bacterium]
MKPIIHRDCLPSLRTANATPSQRGAGGCSHEKRRDFCKAVTAALILVIMAFFPTPALADSETEASERKITVGEAVLLGIVEGVTEYLPISSTGHLILANHALGMTRFSERTGPLGRLMEPNEALNAFDVVIQLGAILAVLGLYRERVRRMFAGFIRAMAAPLSIDTGPSQEDREGLRLLGLLALAFLPAALTGKCFHETIEANLFGPLPVAYALAAGGILMIAAEYLFWQRRGNRPRIAAIEAMRYRQALFIGLLQVLAMWPGTSRSMITIIGGLIVGLDMVAAAEFSFLLALPTLGAATIYSGYRHWDALTDSAGIVALVAGLALSWLTAVVSVKALVKWLTSHGLIPFGIYRIALAAVLLIYFRQWL